MSYGQVVTTLSVVWPGVSGSGPPFLAPGPILVLLKWAALQDLPQTTEQSGIMSVWGEWVYAASCIEVLIFQAGGQTEGWPLYVWERGSDSGL